MRIKIIFITIMLTFILMGCGETSAVDEHANEIQEKIKFPAMDPHGTYDENDLLIIGVEEEVAGFTAEIPQINGLKNKEIQNKINEEMKKIVLEECDGTSSMNFLDYYVESNFANVICISVYYGSDDKVGQVYLNYDLITGEKIAFEELFYEDTDTLEIVRNAFYEALILSQMSGDISENEYYKVVKSFTEAKDKQFAFTPAEIYLYYRDYVASVKMLDIAEEISIYSRYLTEESLYEEDNIGKNDIMTGVAIPYEAMELIDFGYLHENCWFDITSMKEYIGESFSPEKLEKYQLFKKEKYDEVYAAIEEYGERALSNPEKFYIIMSKPSFYVEMDSEWNGEEWLEEYHDTVVVTDNYTILEMPIETYETIYKEKLLEAYRYEYFVLAGGIYLEVTEDEVKTEEQYNQNTYNYMTGEEVN